MNSTTGFCIPLNALFDRRDWNISLESPESPEIISKILRTIMRGSSLQILKTYR